MDNINLLVTIDKKYISPLLTMICSYGAHHKDIQTNLYIAHSSLEEEELDILRKTAGEYNINIISIFIKDKWFMDTPVLERLPQESFYRVMAFKYLPETVDKCLYMDPDIFIMKNLMPLYSLDIDNYYIAAASHTYGLRNSLNILRLDLEQPRYINSGIMLMNVDKIRRDHTIDSILECLKENVSNLLMGDQDLINILFGAAVLYIDEKIYNLDERTLKHYSKTFSLEDVKNNTAIIHYDGKCKPWLAEYKGVLDSFYPKPQKLGPAPNKKLKPQVKAICNIFLSSGRNKIIFAGFLSLILLTLISWILWGGKLIQILSDPVVFRNWLDQFGIFDELIFICIRAAQTIIKFIPAEPLEIGAGYAWGAVPGMLYCVIGNMIGTVVILFLTRKYGRRFVEFFLPSKSINRFTSFFNSGKVYATIFFLYLIPGSPKDGFTYFVGLLPVKIAPFMAISFLARMPSVLSSTLCGSTLAQQRYWLSALIFGITILLAALGALIYKAFASKKST